MKKEQNVYVECRENYCEMPIQLEIYFEDEEE